MVRKTQLSALVFWCLLTSPLVVHAHRGGHGGTGEDTSIRVWTLAATGSHFHASFVSAGSLKATFERQDGSTVTIPRDALKAADQEWIRARLAEIDHVNTTQPAASQAEPLIAVRAPVLRAPVPGQVETPATAQPVDNSRAVPMMHHHFSPFAKTLGLRWDERYYYVESNGLPDHPMMIGITAWQQQVPLPQQYTGTNAWRIPLEPRPAARPMSAKSNFFRGAIALAVNGVPIFNPIKNDGKTDTFLAGELDRWGGHCGRADDYHYHLPPVHLEQLVGKGNPVAYALDGYPIYGYQDPASPDAGPLDWLNGHHDSDGNYHYHATKTYPYLNGGFYGEVVERGGQVDPQPRARGVRPSLTPLRGAQITGFEQNEDGTRYRVEFDVRGISRSVAYEINDDAVEFTFNNGAGDRHTESYARPSVSKAPSQPADAVEPPRSAQRNQQPGARGGRRTGNSSRRPRKGRQGAGDQRSDQAGSERRPWIEVHAAEMDADADGVLTRAEMLTEAKNAFAAYDTEQDGAVGIASLQSAKGVRSAMGGFIRQHASELDRDGDGKLSQEEVIANAARMFDKADGTGNGRISIDLNANQAPANGRSRSEEANRPVAPKTRGVMGKDDGPPTRRRPRPGTAQERVAETGDRPINGDPPNIIFILIDDMGWRDVGFAGNDFLETPHIDRIAREGLTFTQAYASAPNCAPTRACLMSGQYTPRHSVFTVIDSRHEPGQPHHRILSAPSAEALDGECVTIAEVLQQRGYATGCFGMWNLGRGRQGPTTAVGQGFDIYKKPQDLGFERNAYFDAGGKYLTDALFDEGLRFIGEQAHRRPFFLYLPTHAVHAPFEPKPELLQKYRAKASRLGLKHADPTYAAMIQAVDDNVGRLFDYLDRQSLTDNTLIIFTSDNGGTPQYVAPLNGSKGALYEGGIRVPCAVWWSGIANPGRTSDQPILTMDFYPTLAAMAGAPLPAEQPIDGADLTPLLTQGGEVKRESLFWHFPCYIGRGEPCSAIRSGRWKLIEKFEDQSLELYDLENDPGETTNLVTRLPEQAAVLREALLKWQVSLDAPRPQEKNPSFDPSALTNRQRPRTNGGSGRGNQMRNKGQKSNRTK